MLKRQLDEELEHSSLVVTSWRLDILRDTEQRIASLKEKKDKLKVLL